MNGRTPVQLLELFRQQAHIKSAVGISQERIAIVTVSPLSGAESKLEVPTLGLMEWLAGDLIQRALPELGDSERELLMTGYTDADWEKMFGPEE